MCELCSMCEGWRTVFGVRSCHTLYWVVSFSVSASTHCTLRQPTWDLQASSPDSVSQLTIAMLGFQKCDTLQHFNEFEGCKLATPTEPPTWLPAPPCFEISFVRRQSSECGRINKVKEKYSVVYVTLLVKSTSEFSIKLLISTQWSSTN